MLSRQAASAPGRLSLRLLHETRAFTGDGAGGRLPAWSAAGIVFAEIRVVTAEERGTGEGIADLRLHKLTLRHREGLRPGDRLRIPGGRCFLVLSVADPDGDRRYLACLVEEVAA